MTVPGPHRRMLRIAVLAATGAVALTGCGGSGGPSTLHVKLVNGESGKSAGQILRDVRAAVTKASSVHLSGDVQGTTTVGLDLYLAAKGGRGTVSTNGLRIRVTRIGNAAYLSSSNAFYRQFTNAAGMHLLQGRWLKVPVSNARFGAFGDLTDMQALLATILQPKGAVVKAGTQTLHGIAVIGLRDSTGGGTLYIAATGPPFPVELVQSGAHHGVVTFDHWGGPVVLRAPGHPVYLTQLGKRSGIASTA
jgi:hypothetical protein